jgi:hypothetical protein
MNNPPIKPQPDNPDRKWKLEFDRLLDSSNLSQEEYQELINDLEKRKKRERGRGYDRLDDIREE